LSNIRAAAAIDENSGVWPTHAASALSNYSRGYRGGSTTAVQA